MSDLEGVILSDYFLQQCISKGGVADVYRARQNEEGNYEVAVKVFRSGYAQRESFRDYFMSGAEKIGQFAHQNILPFLEFGEGEDLLYVVTPFVATGTLDVLLKRAGGKLSAMQALPIMQQLCSAVQYAHDHDVIHGNIKPTNVFVAADGRMLLSDFGIARGFDDSQQSLTRVGWGSAEYAAPEQSLGLLRRASDIYSLGVLLFRMLTGQPPFTGHTPVEVLLKHVRQPAPSARSLVPDISDAVDVVIHMAMQKRSDDRFASAAEFSDALVAAVTVAPFASPVAQSVVSPSPHTPAPVTNPRTSIPAFNSQPVVSDPQTPIPAYLALTRPTIPLPPEDLSAAQEPERPEPTAPAEGSGSDITDKYPKSFLEEDNDDAGTHIFWSVNPVEWSPIGDKAESAVPEHAAEYLRSKPLVLEVQPSSPTPPKEPGDTGNHSLNARVKKWLPLAVVVLLLLGLLGALLSSLLFSSQSPVPNSGQVTSPATTGLQSTAVTPATTPTHGKTATPAAKHTPTAGPIVAATQPASRPTGVPTNPPGVSFSCTTGAITLDGSANFQPAIQQLTTDYTTACSNTAPGFTVNANGSKSSLDSVASGNIDLAYSDLTSTGRAGLVDYQVAALIYTVVVNSDTQVTNLSTSQLQGIYSGRITNWSQVGGTNEAITIITRPADSAIRALFEAFVLHGTAQTASGSSLWFDSSDAVTNAVLQTSGSISYVPLSAALTNGAQSVALNGASPTAGSVSTGAYPFWSVEHLYSNQAAIGLAQSFITYCATTTGATDLANYGAVPIRHVSQAALASHIPGPLV